MEAKRVIKFTVEKATERPEKLSKNVTVFGLLMSERVKIQPHKVKKILMNFNMYILEDMLRIIVLSPSLQK